MKKFAYYSDLAFCFFAVGLFTLCYFRYLQIPLLFALLLSAMLGGSATLLLSFFFKRRQNAVFLKKREAEEAEKLALHLSLCNKDSLADFFANALQAKTFVKNEECFAWQENTLVLYKFTPTPLQAESVLPLLYESGENPATLYCHSLTEEADRFCRRFGIKTVTTPELFKLLQKENALPAVYKSERAFLKQKRRKFKLRFAKSHSLRFLTSGAMLLAFSVVTPFPYYYLVIGGGLAVASLFVRIFGNE